MEAGYLSYATLPRRSSKHTAEESHAMDLERKLACLNITQSGPIPPPRLKRMSKKLTALPSKLPTNSVDSGPLDSKLKASQPQKRTCDIIESSQWRNDLLSEPDLLSHSTNTESTDQHEQLKTSTHTRASSHKGHSSFKIISSHNSRSTLFTGTQKFDKEANKLNTEKQITDPNKNYTSSGKHGIGFVNNAYIKAKQSSLPRFSFYRPSTKSNKSRPIGSTEQLPSSRSLNEKEVVSIGQKLSSPDGSFVNPAFNISNQNSSSQQVLRHSFLPGDASRITRKNQLAKPLTVDVNRKTQLPSAGRIPKIPHSPPSTRFNRHLRQPKLEDPQPVQRGSGVSKSTPLKALQPIKVPSAQRLNKPPTADQPLTTDVVEKGLKQYQMTKLDPGDMCSETDLENMMKYYKISSPENPTTSESTPPAKLTHRHKSGSPFSSSSSLNISGETLDAVHRRKKKVKIRSSSFSSDDESIKRISLEINLSQSPTSSEPANKLVKRKLSLKPLMSNESVNAPANDMTRAGKLSGSNTSLNGTMVEKLELDDLTSTETAKLLKKQFSKLKVRANSLKVKDTELKQRFLILQNKRGRLSSSSGGITKARSRTSLV